MQPDAFGFDKRLWLILVLALMVWRLMERTMRVSLKEGNSKVVGWNNRQTTRPTSFMMTTKFVSVIVIRTAERRFLAEPLDQIQEKYPNILGLSDAVFTNPASSFMPPEASQMQQRRSTGRSPTSPRASSNKAVYQVLPRLHRIPLSVKDAKKVVKSVILGNTKAKMPL